MTRKLKTFDIRQDFNAGPVLTSFYRGFPKFRGYWKLLELLARFLPRSSIVFQGNIVLENRSFKIPVDIRDPYQIDIFAKNKRELCVPTVLAKLLKKGDFYLDVGANCGWYCRFMCEVVGETGLVVALEPGRRAFPFLTKLTYGNLLPLRYAATATNGQILVEDTATAHQWDNYKSASDGRGFYGAGEGIEVGRSIDNLLSEFRRLPDAIKVDVEGAELEVLRGAKKVLQSVRAVLIEVNTEESCQKCGYTPREVYEFMAEQGFVHRYEVRNHDNSVYQIEEGEVVPGDILFTRQPLVP